MTPTSVYVNFRLQLYLCLAVFISLQNEIHMSAWLSAIAIPPSRCFLILTSFCVWAEQCTLCQFCWEVADCLRPSQWNTEELCTQLSLLPVNVLLKGRRMLTGWLSLDHVFWDSSMGSIAPDKLSGTQFNDIRESKYNGITHIALLYVWQSIDFTSANCRTQGPHGPKPGS
jgi:hypothetical protein